MKVFNFKATLINHDGRNEYVPTDTKIECIVESWETTTDGAIMWAVIIQRKGYKYNGGPVRVYYPTFKIGPDQ